MPQPAASGAIRRAILPLALYFVLLAFRTSSALGQLRLLLALAVAVIVLTLVKRALHNNGIQTSIPYPAPLGGSGVCGTKKLAGIVEGLMNWLSGARAALLPRKS